jgi:hypothetical protein
LKVEVSSKKKLPFFREERTVRVSEFTDSIALSDFVRKLPRLFSQEIPELFSLNERAQLVNLRGRPAVIGGVETNEENLIRLVGSAPMELLGGEPDEEEQKQSFEIVYRTKFKEFQGSKIVYTLHLSHPEQIERQNLEGFITHPEVAFSIVELGLDLYESRPFPFLSINLQELRERLFFQIQSNSSDNLQGPLSSQLEVVHTSYQPSVGYSPRLMAILKFLETEAALPNLTENM